jgi:hypothetical protein
MLDFSHFKHLQQEVLNQPEIKEQAKPDSRGKLGRLAGMFKHG